MSWVRVPPPQPFHGNILKNLISNSHFQHLHDEVREQYLLFMDDLLVDMSEGYQSAYFSENFFREIGPILASSDLKNFSSSHLFWAQLIEQLITIIQLHEEAQELRKDIEQEDLEAVQEDIFNFWNAHEHSHLFVEFTQSGLEPEAASLELIPLLENQILSFYYLQLTRDPFVSDSPLIYQAIPERGDGDQGIVIGDRHTIAGFDLKKLNGLFSFSRVDHQKGILEIQNSEEEIFVVEFLKDSDLISHNKFSLFYLPICEKGVNKKDELMAKIKKALQRLEKLSPDCYLTLCSFTHSIIPINDTGIVSFSLQSLPGYSSINLFERDDVDLLDDLVHENGHHFLNAYLNHQELINEDDDDIFYSPWRRSFRPIRGLYHAYLTFCWALRLFSDVAASKEKQTIFSQKELSKIHLRVLEEYEMLVFCHRQIDKAFKLKKITPEGMELYKEFKTFVLSCSESLNDLESQLFDKDKRDFEDLKSHLAQVSAQYKI